MCGLALNSAWRGRVHHRQVWPSQSKAVLLGEGQLSPCSQRVPAAGGTWCKGWMGKSYLRKQKPQLSGLRQPREGEETSSMPSLCYGAEGFPGMRSILIGFSTCICNSPWKPSRLQIISWSLLLRTGGKATQKSAGFMWDWEKKAQHPFPASR